MTLDHFLLPKEIMIDSAGWSDLLLGVVIGALKPPDPRLMDRRIPTSSFQPPNFKNKKYLVDAIKIADEIIEVMKPDDETHFRVCSGYIGRPYTPTTGRRSRYCSRLHDPPPGA